VIAADRRLIAVAKPAGLLSVPGMGAHLQDSVATRARCLFPGARIVHRLDLDTSGVMAMALDAAAHRSLSMAFADRRVAKTYIACVAGEPAADAGEIDLPLAGDPARKPRHRVDPGGRPSLTRWLVLAREGGTARLELHPVTGRSHQLRVHLEAAGHPILGDPLYGDAASRAAAPRLLLHATSLTVPHPGGRGPVTFTDPCPF
jgi:tRNA pseudouridine32 synthase/23S rRNA pseudouridine746 synthase